MSELGLCGCFASQAVETEVVVVVEGVGTPEFEALAHSLLVAAVDKQAWESEPLVALQNSAWVASPVECDYFASQVVETEEAVVVEGVGTPEFELGLLVHHSLVAVVDKGSV